MNGELEKQLKEELLEACRICKEELNYNPLRFLQMLYEKGPVVTSIQLVNSSVPSDGFTKLWEKNALNLTVEAHVIKSKFKPLFSDEIIEKARTRLHDYGYGEN